MLRLFELRKRNKLTQEKLAEILHVDQTTVSAWEKGKSAPSSDTLSTIAELFNVTIDYLLGRENTAKTPVYDDETLELLKEFQNRPEIKALLKTGKTLTKEDVEKAIRIIEALKGNDNTDVEK